MAVAASSPIETFESVCASPYQAARNAAKDRRVAGYLCSYAPQELLHAAGYFPVRVFGREGNTPKADELVQPFACSLARSSLDSALSGELDFLSLVVFSHTCDTMQNMADLWRRNRPNLEVLVVSVPTQTKGSMARDYFVKELRRVRSRIEALSGPISDANITQSIDLYYRHRSALRRLYDLRREHPGRLTGRQMQAVVTSSMLMPREEHLPLLEKLVDEVESAEGGHAPAGPRVLVAGSVCQNSGFITAIEEAGCTVVDDDLCMGARSAAQDAPGSGDPIEVLADLYLSRRPCPAFHAPGFDPGAHLVARAEQAKAEGVIFLLTKFCDPWFFDYVPVNQALEKAGIPSLLLEIEQHLPVPEQLRTRTQAFIEMIEARAVS